MRGRVPEPQRRLHRTGPVDQKDPPPAVQRSSRAGLRGRPAFGGAREGGRAERGQVEPVEVADDHQRAGPASHGGGRRSPRRRSARRPRRGCRAGAGRSAAACRRGRPAGRRRRGGRGSPSPSAARSPRRHAPAPRRPGRAAACGPPRRAVRRRRSSRSAGTCTLARKLSQSSAVTTSVPSPSTASAKAAESRAASPLLQRLGQHRRRRPPGAGRLPPRPRRRAGQHRHREPVPGQVRGDDLAAGDRTAHHGGEVVIAGRRPASGRSAIRLIAPPPAGRSGSPGRPAPAPRRRRRRSRRR